MAEYNLPQLHPDLQPYLQDGELHHPLVDFEHDIPALYSRTNQVYEYKQRQIHDSDPPNEWATYFPHRSAADRYRQFITQEIGRQDPEFFKIIGQIWTDYETLGQGSSFLEMMLSLEPFQGSQLLPPNVVHLMTETEREKLSQLPEDFIVYRGHHPRLLNGISWTIDRNIALQYALGWHKNSQISSGIVSKKSVIAVIDRWHESEAIVPTRLVREIDTQTATPGAI
jgi:hypothetical protein